MRSTLKCDIIFPKDSKNAMVMQMKKKIVYISGADSFDAAQVRAAFEEVRSTLGLDTDTVLFGVPVDDLIAVETTPAVADSVDEVIEPKEIEEPAPKVKKTSKAKKEKSVETPVVPILSVLGGGEETAEAAEPAEEVALNEVESPVVHEEFVETVEMADVDDIDEILADDAPVETHEKTLEELLETMTPLGEDTEDSPVAETPEPAAKDEPLDDADATLASLATEFVDVQDKVPTFKKSSERGKISKLKNILPFKKMKRDDTGIMGDLFGWAGVAANDEEFSIPGFFTNVASKK